MYATHQILQPLETQRQPLKSGQSREAALLKTTGTHVAHPQIHKLFYNTACEEIDPKGLCSFLGKKRKKNLNSGKR